MFVQIIEARTNDAAGLRRQADRWDSEVRPGATGFLGSTVGATDDGRFIAVARFESAEAARKNSERREQSEWWAETEKYFDGQPTFKESEDVDVMLEPSGTPGFVQVMQGRLNDEAKYREFFRQHIDDFRQVRPDVVGDVAVYHGNGEYTETIYFRSEAEAREGEQKMTSEANRALFDEFMSHMAGEPSFYDLKDPILQ